MSILEELWYGNVAPSDYDTAPCQEALMLVCRNEEKLKVSMTDAQKELFVRYLDSVHELQALTECILFQNSFRLGAKMMMEITENPQ